ncbi:adhesion G-protein coupled receptor G2-like [Dreissena polymorpha]|uniref:adhesion G-protein coupled receptor G2-like n=1 Tax=Dreissena polymorpha TaxID=45954 RepID=UPI002263B1C7|nr:adhesion G-protein coupled receptor G2-like [Dreissena polymorpha]
MAMIPSQLGTMTQSWISGSANISPGSKVHLKKSHTSEDNVTTTTRAPDNSRLTFQFIWYANANLFPITTSHHDDPVLRGKTWVVISAVLSVSLSEPVSNLSEPIEIVFEIPPTDSKLTAAYWDYTANGGNWDWRTDGCSIVERRPMLATVHCDHLTAFEVLKVTMYL